MTSPSSQISASRSLREAEADDQAAAGASAPRSTRAGLLMATGTIVSRLLGLLRTVMLATALGAAGYVADIWDLANVLPNQIYGMIAGGVFSAILVPMIVKASRAKDGGSDYLSRLITLLVTFMAISTVLAVLAAPLIMEHGPNFTPAQTAVATQLAYFLFPQIFFYGLYAIIGQVLNARESYGPFMWSPVLNNLIAMATLGLFMLMFGAEANGQHHTIENWTFEKSLVLGLGTTLGIVVQALVLFIPLRRLNLNLRPNFNFRGMGLRQTAKLGMWTSLTMVIGNIPLFVFNLVEARATTYRQEQAALGHHETVAGATMLTNASLLAVLPHAVIAVSLATLLVNRLSQAAADDDLPRLRSTLNRGLKTLGLPIIICAFGLIVLAGPLGAVFSPDNPRAGVYTGILTVIMMISMPLYSAAVFIMRTFYTVDDARTPFFISTGIALLSIALSLSIYFIEPQYSVFGIALVTAVSNIANFIVCHLVLTRKIGSYSPGTIFDSWAKFTAAGLLASAFGIGLLWLLGGYSETGFAWSGRFGALAACAAVASVMGLIYLGLLRLLKSEELGDVMNPILAKVRR